MSVVDFRVPPLTRSATVKVPPSRAFAIFVGDFARWWPLARFHTGSDPVDCKIEAQVGGRVYERASDGEESVSGTRPGLRAAPSAEFFLAGRAFAGNRAADRHPLYR